MTLELIKEILPPEQAEQVLRFWPTLITAEKKLLSEQVQNIDFKRLKQQIKLIDKPDPLPEFAPYTEYAFSGNKTDFQHGKKLIREGKMGCIVLAGGQGTRLGFEGPKGLYPTTIIKHKTLFQICFERVLAASKQAGCDLSIAVMTSSDNDYATRQFLADQNYFGLKSDQVSFYSQGTLPLLDAEGLLFLEQPYKIAEGPDGNGQCLHNFVKAGLWDEWKRKGIKYVNIVLIDNPLADPFDAELLGFHTRRKLEATVKCIEKLQPDENVGVLVKEKGHCRVIEYSELPEAEKNAVEPSGHLKYCCANLSLLCFSMDFISSVVNKHPHLPLHKSWKTSKFVNPIGITQTSTAPNAWKFENYIFDLLAYTNYTAALLYPRNLCYAPLKNYIGENSIATVQESLLSFDQKILESITGLPAPTSPFELSADFYYPTSKLLDFWKEREPDSPYVDPFVNE